MSVFEANEEEFLGVCRQCSKAISQASTYENDADKKLDLLNNVSRDLGQAKDLIRQMEVEVRSQDSAAAKRALADKVSSHKQTLSALQRDYDETKQAAERHSLLGSTSDAQDDAALEQRSRLMCANERLERGSSRIRNAMELVNETEMTGEGLR